MKAMVRMVAMAAVASAVAAAQAKPPAQSAEAIPPRQQTFFYHYEWTRGAVLTGQEWKQGAAIAHPQQEGLPAAPAGEEWREIDRNYVLASQSTHAIVRVVAAPHPTVAGNSGGEP